tara:strand:- start:239 stop:1993 length:1755 start_codon:yes stop_codon:yes gene_type:complete
MKNFRIHVLGIPHTVTSEDFLAEAFTQKALKFCKMMKDRGHTVFHYGHEDSNTMADEDVTVITNKAWKEVYGTHDYRNKLFIYDTGDKIYQEFFKNAIAEIKKRKQPNDIVLPFWGSGVRPICDAHNDLNIIEPGIGYAGGHWAPFKIFESYAILHAYQGLANVGNCHQGHYDIVIPNYFDLDHFEYNQDKDDYFLFLGRVYDGKGINIALQVTDAAGVKLKVAGQPDETYTDYDWPDHVEFVGYAGVEERKELMKNAKGSLLPSQYLEPFGGVQIENLLAGTPTITADWGAFAENNIEGVTGYRCRTFEDYVRAIKNVQAGKIKSIDCRKHAEKFSLEAIAPMYENFFRKVTDISIGKGWYEIWDESLYTKEYLEKNKIQLSVNKWFSERGDFTHNLNCDLTKDSIVFDVGGYAGEWAERIYNKYKCTIYVFEPVKEFYDNIVERFKGNNKIKPFHIGLGNKTYTTDIKLMPDLVGSSVYRENSITGKVESINIVDIIEFMEEHKLESVDLLKLNIEGEEFPLLEHLIDNNKLSSFNNLKIQFHNFMESAVERKNNIRIHLQKEFNIIYDFFFVWEGWKRKNL